MQKKHQLFVYGTLRRGYGNNFLLRNSEFVKEAAITGFLKTGSISVSPGKPKDIVEGELWLVPEDDLLGPIDRLEHHPHWYVRTWVADQLGGFWIYLIPNDYELEIYDEY